MPAGRPPKDPALLRRALELCAAGMSPRDAAEALGGQVSWRTIYRALDAANKPAPAKPPVPAPLPPQEAAEDEVDDPEPPPRPPTRLVRLQRPARRPARRPAPEPVEERVEDEPPPARAAERGEAPPPLPPPLPPPPAPPPGLKGLELDLWIIEQEILATRAALALARVPGSPLFIRIPALQKQLDDWMERRRELRPPEPPSPDEEERTWRAQADAVLQMIEAGVRKSEEKHAVAQVSP